MNKKTLWIIFRLLMSLTGLTLIILHLAREDANPGLLTSGLALNSISLLLTSVTNRKNK